MVTQISLGGAYQSNGKTVLNGSQSQLDTKSIIDALVAAKEKPATDLTAVNKTIDKQLTALTGLKSLLSQFQSASDVLRNQPGVQNAAKTIFQYRTATVTTTTGAAASNFLNVSVQPGASIQNFSVDSITQLAQQTKQQTGLIAVADTTSASAVQAAGGTTANLFSAGTFTLKNIDGTADTSITLVETDTLQAVANKFNAVQSHTGIQANIIKVADGSYKIIFNGTKTGADNGFDLTSSTTVTTDTAGVFSQMKDPLTGFSTQQSAQNSKFKLDGVTVERDSNSVDDLLTGVTFTLKQSTLASGTSLNVDVQPDSTLVQSAVTQFADAYNKLKLFFSTQTQIGDDGLPKETAVLANDSTMRTIAAQVNGIVTSVVNGLSGSNPSRLADVGITFDDFAGDDTNPETKNIMTVDTDKLTSALAANFNGVAGLFQYQMTSDNPNLATYKQSNKLTASSFQLNITQTSGAYGATATYVDPSLGTRTVALDVSNLNGTLTLTGQKGTVFEGSAYIFANATTPATINVSVTQGIGSQIYNAMNDMLDSTSGALTLDTQNLTDQQTRNKTEITKIEDKMTSYRDQLTAQYATLESALSKANQLLQLLDAQSQARNSSNG